MLYAIAPSAFVNLYNKYLRCLEEEKLSLGKESNKYPKSILSIKTSQLGVETNDWVTVLVDKQKDLSTNGLVVIR